LHLVFYSTVCLSLFETTTPVLPLILFFRQVWKQSPRVQAVGKGCPTRGPHAAPEVVLSGPRCNKFLSRLFKFHAFFIGSRIFAIKTYQNHTCCFCYGPTTQKLV